MKVKSKFSSSSVNSTESKWTAADSDNDETEQIRSMGTWTTFPKLYKSTKSVDPRIDPFKNW